MRTTFSFILALICCLLLAQPVNATIRDAFPALPGWTHATPYQDDSPDRNGILLSGRPVGRGSPVIADVDGNPANGNEVVVGGEDGRVYAYRANGTLLWERDTPVAGCHPTAALINGKASVGDLFGNGVPHVVIGYGSMENVGRACDGGIVVYRGPDGQPVWNFSQRDFDARTVEGPENIYGVMSVPALADADGDGRQEIAFGGLDRNVYLLNADGSLRWYYHAADSMWSTPLFLNIDADPALELIVATDVTANPGLVPPTHDGGFLQAFKTAPVPGGRIPFQTGFIWRVPFDQVLYSSPLAADLLPENPGPEIAIGSGCFFPIGSADKRGRWIKIIRPGDGAVLQTLNAPACVQSSPAVGDIDNDGQLEIVATVSGAREIGGDGFSRIVAWDPANPQPKWSTVPRDPNSGSNDPYGGDVQSAVIADIDGNGSLEVIAANFWSVHVLDGATGAPLTCQNSQCGPLPSMFAWFTLKSTPAVGDINGDGQPDLVIGGGHVYNPSRGHLYAWTGFAGRLNSPSGQLPPFSAPWPQFRRDARGSGVFKARGIVPSTYATGNLISCQHSRDVTIGIASQDGQSLDWRVTQVTGPASQFFSVQTEHNALRISFDGCNINLGSYTGNLELQAQGIPPVTISVTTVVVDRVFEVAVPLVRR